MMIKSNILLISVDNKRLESVVLDGHVRSPVLQRHCWTGQVEHEQCLSYCCNKNKSNLILTKYNISAEAQDYRLS